MISQDNLRELEERGYLAKEIDPTLDLFEEIEKLKKEKKCCYFSSLLSGGRHSRYC
jgi:hypothetical protein